MTRPLAERLASDSPALARFVKSLPYGEYRRSITRRFKSETLKLYQRRYRRYVEWCGMKGYQAEPLFITTDTVREFTEHMCGVLNYAPQTVRQGIRALQVYAEAAGVDVNCEPSWAVVGSWVGTLGELERQGQVEPR